jgi:DNA-binding LacI/PurR family transcriptional regulator
MVVTTIKDVAARAGVGIGTVSRVLNGHPAVTTETRQRVLSAIEVLDYHPSSVARALSRKRSGSIAVVVPFLTHPSSVERLRGVLAVVDDSPYEVVLFNLGGAEHRQHRFTRALRRDLAEGLLFISVRLSEAEATLLHKSGLAAVVVDASWPELTSVVVDDVEGGRMAGRHLLALGHERVGYIGDDVVPELDFTSSTLRLQGLSDVLEASGHPLNPEWVRLGPHGRELACRLATELLEGPERPTAIFAHSDTQAIGVLEAAEQLGISVPDELSVIGFDDIEAARYAGLTTVAQPLFESGLLGASLLLDRLEDPEAPAQARHELSLQIVERRTTGPAPALGRTRASSRASRGRRASNERNPA